MENLAACFCACRAVRCLRPWLCSRRLPPNFGNRTPSREILQSSKTHVAVEFNDLGVLLTCDLHCLHVCYSATWSRGVVEAFREAAETLGRRFAADPHVQAYWRYSAAAVV